MPKTIMVLASLTAWLAGCSERETILPGERLDVRSGLTVGEAASDPGPDVPVNRAFAPPPMVNLGSWTHRAGNPTHSVSHAALSPTPTRVWSVDIGQGNTRKHRITADPIVAGGRIMTVRPYSAADRRGRQGEQR